MGTFVITTKESKHFSVIKKMAYHFSIVFPDAPLVVKLIALTEADAERMEIALVALDADYTVRGPKWSGGSFRLTSEARAVLDRLIDRRTSGPASSGDTSWDHVVPESGNDCLISASCLNDHSITNLDCI